MVNFVSKMLATAIAFVLIAYGILLIAQAAHYRIVIFTIEDIYIIQPPKERSDYDLQGNYPNVKHLESSEAYRD